MPAPMFKAVIRYVGTKTLIFQHPTIETIEQAEQAADKFFEKGQFSKGPLPNNALPINNPNYVEGPEDPPEEIVKMKVTQESRAPGDCRFCAEEGKFVPAQKCREHCRVAGDGQHVPDPSTIRPQDPPDPIEDGKFAADINCKNCGANTGIIVEVDDISWD